MTERRPRHVAVVDIGKTNVKLALVDLEALGEIVVRKAPNTPRRDGLYIHHDVDAIWTFVLDAIRAVRATHSIDAIIVTTHGATAVLVDPDGRLALPVLDYEDAGPDTLRAAYDAVRPPFAESGSPRLPGGLNVGAQLFWQAMAHAEGFAHAATILMYPQYWAMRLCGARASEVTSLGAHTDLWNPAGGTFSTLVERQGWRGLFAPLHRAGDVLGTVLPDVAASTGLDPATTVHCGLHDSNASLVPHLLTRQPPFAVVSTGTWVIVMAVDGHPATLDPERDTLVNVNAFGEPVRSARFMGGREVSLLTGSDPSYTDEDVASVLESGVMLLPSLVPDCGPYPGRTACWIGGEEPQGGRRAAAASLYAALMTATSLELVGAEGPVVVEGSFAASPAFCRMLAAATGRPVLPQQSATGTSVGAAMLTAPHRAWQKAAETAATSPAGPWWAYARSWRRHLGD